VLDVPAVESVEPGPRGETSMVDVRSAGRAVLLGLGLLCTLGCSGPKPPKIPPPGPPLRVGAFVDNPPIALRQDGQLAGIEIDFARQLAPFLNRELVVVPLGREDLMPALLDRRIDVIMSGIAKPTTPQYRLTFSHPYLYTGLATLVRQADARLYTSPASILNSTRPVGVAAGSDAARFAPQLSTRRLTQYPDLAGAVQALRQGEVDLVIAEAHLLGWYARQDPSLAGIWMFLNNNQLVWMFRVEDAATCAQTNAVLDWWRQDGTLNRTLRKWLPYWPGLDFTGK
jgi:polar amino acid transport system substrate-binding protein